jgi:hypothetical protein
MMSFSFHQWGVRSTTFAWRHAVNSTCVSGHTSKGAGTHEQGVGMDGGRPTRCHAPAGLLARLQSSTVVAMHGKVVSRNSAMKNTNARFPSLYSLIPPIPEMHI